MNTYLYSGPTTGLTLRGEKGATTEVMLFRGKEVQLPDIKEVRTLIALKRLTPVPEATASAPASAPKASASAPDAVPAVDGPVDTGAASPVATTAKKGA